MVFVLCLICLYFLLDRSGNLTQREPESVRLARHMNDGPPTYPYTFVKSSVDWGQIPHRYLTPRDLIQLPTRCHVSPLPRVQHRFKPESREVRRARDARRRAVRELTRKCWESYREYAWKQDALMPLSATGRDQFSGWAATLVDSLDTLWIMGFREEFDEAVAAVAAIDFGVSTTSDQVNIFETNIRYLGGLLAAYDLSGREVLLQKAIELGNLIYAGFNTENRMPVDNINLTAAKEGTGLFVEDQVVSASPGTLTMELAHLSQLTGDPKYYDAINRVVDLFFRNQNRTALPGLFPQYVSMSREDVTTGASFTLGGGADSLYEYFPKMYALLGGLESKYATLTLGFMDAAKRHLFFRPMVPDNADILMSGNVFIDGENIYDYNEEKLAIFRRRKIGFIFQFFNLIPVLTVEENISLPALIDHDKVDKAYLNELIDILGLSNRRNHLPSELSGGQQQRVAIGRALLNKPSIILADEPTGNLDSKHSKDIIELLKFTAKKYNQTILLITHDIQIAEMADRIVTIQDGEIISDQYLQRS